MRDLWLLASEPFVEVSSERERSMRERLVDRGHGRKGIKIGKRGWEGMGEGGRWEGGRRGMFGEPTFFMVKRVNGLLCPIVLAWGWGWPAELIVLLSGCIVLCNV
jgi:hypothetical protein